MQKAFARKLVRQSQHNQSHSQAAGMGGRGILGNYFASVYFWRLILLQQTLKIV